MLHLLFAAAVAWQLHGSSAESAEPFESAAITWSASQPSRMRVSDDGAKWSDWFAIPADHDSPNGSAIVHFGRNARYLEVDPRLEGLTVTVFPPQTRRLSPAPQSVSVGHLLARSRTDWKCPDGEDAAGWKPQYSTVTHLVVHHTAGANSVPDWEAEVRSIWYLHTFTNGWGDIGYNFLIDPNGVIYEGRAGGAGAIGAHFSCRNTNTAGVALLGTFTSGLPTQAALDALEHLLAELAERNHIDPKAFAWHVPSEMNVPTIIGHRDGNTSPLTCTRTECPGDALYAMLPAIRNDVAAIKPQRVPRRRSARP
jgi:hypothetical protein